MFGLLVSTIHNSSFSCANSKYLVSNIKKPVVFFWGIPKFSVKITLVLKNFLWLRILKLKNQRVKSLKRTD